MSADDPVALAGEARAARATLRSDPMLAALRVAGTKHVYADTADVAELARTIGAGFAEVDGNTANQPLVEKALPALLAAGAVPSRANLAANASAAGVPAEPAQYAMLCTGIADAMQRFAGERGWASSVQLHMSLCADVAAAKKIAHALAEEIPGVLVKVPFAPHLPETLLLVRDLEREGVRVNLTSTFSARQAVAAALLCRATRTNIFMGRLNQGLQAGLLGEHVCLEAQRALLALRRAGRTATQLIVASLRDWHTFVHVAGCDAFTSPCGVLRGFIEQREIAAGAIVSRLETSYADRLGVSDAVLGALGAARIARLYRVEPEFIEFLLALRASRELEPLHDGAVLARRFEQAGFGDFFFAPTPAQWTELRQDKLVPPGSALAPLIALDTHYTLRAHADFEQHQQAIDARLAARPQ